ncbi:hypothetical protein HA402_002801 [Bradysia odoriphaga]|nr:hypothetical protein HA402_002801 [Bradysia odoriphaga]
MIGIETELQSTVQSRKSSKDGAYLTTTELVKLMKWKLTRGKFRPRLEQLAGSNSDDMVKNTTKEAFELLSKSTSIDSAKQSLLKLNCLKGIGPATSSAILSLFSPDSLPFMSDEALKFAAGLSEKPKYTVKEWEWFVAEMRKRMKKEDWSGTDELEKAAWSFAVLKPAISDSGEKNTKRVAVEAELTSSVKRMKRK